jgi:putative membrane protein
MPEITEEKESVKVRNRRVHMANERTFLAWIRTSIGIMAFGFVVEKFGLFLRQVSFFLGRSPEMKTAFQHAPQGAGYSSIFGIFLIGLGAIMGVLAFVRYKKVEKQIDEDSYRPSVILDIMLTLSIFAVGLFLIIYLLHSF